MAGPTVESLQPIRMDSSGGRDDILPLEDNIYLVYKGYILPKLRDYIEPKTSPKLFAPKESGPDLKLTGEGEIQSNYLFFASSDSLWPEFFGIFVWLIQS